MNDDSLNVTFAALADPTRRAILARLAQGEATVGELAKPFGMSPPAISWHLKMLEGADLIERRIDAQRRRCRLKAGALRQVADWVDDYRHFWNTQLDRLALHFEEKKKSNDRGDSQ